MVVLTGNDSSGISFIPSFLRASLTHTHVRGESVLAPCGLDQCSLLQHPFEGGVECFLGYAVLRCLLHGLPTAEHHWEGIE